MIMLRSFYKFKKNKKLTNPQFGQFESTASEDIHNKNHLLHREL